MKRIPLLAVALVAGTASLVSARRIIEYREYAAPSVVDISSVQLGRTSYRAITGFERRRPYLVIEEVGWTRRGRYDRGGAPLPAEAQDMRDGAELAERYDDFDGRRGSLAVRVQRPISFVILRNQQVGLEQFRSISLEGWYQGRLGFVAQGSRGSYRCSVGANDQAPATCEGTWQDPTPPVPPPPAPGPGPYPGPSPDIDRLRAAGRACGAVFSGTANIDACVQLFLQASTDLGPTLSACSRTLSGSSAILDCMRRGQHYSGDGAAVIGRCASHFSGSTSVMACFDLVAQRNLRIEVIPACASTFSGSTSILGCMSAVGYHRDPVELIRYCRENFSGSTAILGCIEKYH